MSLFTGATNGGVGFDAININESLAQVHWLAVSFEAYLDIYAASQAMYGEESAITVTKASNMNRFQRSLISNRVPAVAKDSTVRVSNFLKSCLGILNEFLRRNATLCGDWKVCLAIPHYILMLM